MDKFISGYCVGGCGEMITEDSGFVTILKNGGLLCDYCRDELGVLPVGEYCEIIKGESVRAGIDS